MPAGSQDDSPLVMNISDPWRPTAIARKYYQLYEGEWKDGLEILCQSGKTASENAETLINIVKRCYLFCVQRADIQSKKVIEALLLFDSTSPDKEDSPHHLNFTQGESLKDLQLEACAISKETVIKEYCGHERIFHGTQQALLPFKEKCVELCWYMVLQSPPVYIEDCDKYTQGADFNTDVFKFYTRSGTKLDFVVWPPLYLHKHGPLLSKGVAEALSI